MSAASDKARYDRRAEEKACVSCGAPEKKFRRCFRCRRKRAAEQHRRDLKKRES